MVGLTRRTLLGPKSNNKIQNTNAANTRAGKMKQLWERHYDTVSYVVYATLGIYAVIYLVYVFSILSDRKMLLNYKPVKAYLAYNSYSLLNPIMSVIIACILTYMTKTKVSLSDGDFFGIIGLILFFACVSFHDGIGIQHLIVNETEFARNNSSVERSEWLISWSTKPKCVLSYNAPENDDPISTDANVGPMDQSLSFVQTYTPRPLRLVLGGDDTTTTKAPKETKKVNLLWTNRLQYGNDCIEFHDKNPVARPRIWMQAMQKDLDCCGPGIGKIYFKPWSERVNDTMCEKGVTQTCGKPFLKHVNGVFLTTAIVMYLETTFLLLTAVFFMIHYAVMKKEKVTVSKAYSLLRITSHTVLHGYPDAHHDHFHHHHHRKHHTDHSHYIRYNVKRRKFQNDTDSCKDVSQPPRLDSDVIFHNVDEAHKDLEAIFLARSDVNAANFPLVDGTNPTNEEITQNLKRPMFRISEGKPKVPMSAVHKAKAKKRASQAVAVASAAAAALQPTISDDDVAPDVATTSEERNENPASQNSDKKTEPKGVSKWFGF